MNTLADELEKMADKVRAWETGKSAIGQPFGLTILGQLRGLREGAGFSYSDLARISGVSRSYLHQVEQGESEPTLGMVQKVLAVYGLQLAIVPLETAAAGDAAPVR